MNGTVMMERTAMGMPNTTVGGTALGGTGGVMAPNLLMVPRCTVKMERCTGGLTITCTAEDVTARTMMQNLCKMMAGGMCSVACMCNGMMVCCCNLTMGLCKCEMTKEGCKITCTSGDKMCCDMIQGCCDCLAACMAAGCTCCVMMGGTPIC